MYLKISYPCNIVAMSFYMMNNHSSTRNILKIGYMSTTNIKQIISRYATGCGNNITVFQFLDHDPKRMETLFKSRFEQQNVELEFFDSAFFFQYLEWCMDYTKSSPITGYGKFKCVSEVERKSVTTQCDIDIEPNDPVCESVPLPFYAEPESLPPQQPSTESELVMSKLESVTSTLHNIFGKTREVMALPKTSKDESKFVILPTNVTQKLNRVKCKSCEQILFKKNFTRHISRCKGVPKNTCIYCKRVFNFVSNQCKHQNICKLNPANKTRKNI